MSVEVVIKNRKIIKKALTIQDLTMGKYECGTQDQYFRYTGEVTEGNLIIYDPKKIGRGISINPWKANLKTEVHLVANTFSTKYDFEMFYDIIKNIMHIWKTTVLEQDGDKHSIDELNDLCVTQKHITLDFMCNIENITQNSKDNDINIFGAMYPLYIEKDAFKKFGMEKDEEGYADYLHSLQCMDAYYAIPVFYSGKDKSDSFFGNYTITSETDTIFPITPNATSFQNNPKTGKPLECSLYAVSLYSNAKDKLLAVVSFDDFCKLADIENCEKHDCRHVILKGISEVRLANMAAAGCPDPLEDFK